MKKADKDLVIEDLAQRFSETSSFYITDASGMTVAEVNDLRRACFDKGIHLRVAKNTLIEKAFGKLEGNYEGVLDLLKGPTAIMFTDTPNLPAKVIKKFRGKDGQKPVLKGAYIDEAVFVGEGQLDALESLKSKNELIADVIFLLQSPIRNVVSALQSGGHTVAGLVKALEQRAEA